MVVKVAHCELSGKVPTFHLVVPSSSPSNTNNICVESLRSRLEKWLLSGGQCFSKMTLARVRFWSREMFSKSGIRVQIPLQRLAIYSPEKTRSTRWHHDLSGLGSTLCIEVKIFSCSPNSHFYSWNYQRKLRNVRKISSSLVISCILWALPSCEPIAWMGPRGLIVSRGFPPRWRTSRGCDQDP